MHHISKSTGLRGCIEGMLLPILKTPTQVSGAHQAGYSADHVHLWRVQVTSVHIVSPGDLCQYTHAPSYHDYANMRFVLFCTRQGDIDIMKAQGASRVHTSLKQGILQETRPL